MIVEILKPDKKIFIGEAEYVDIPGEEGMTGILKNHAPLIAALKAGEVKVREKNKKEHLFKINGGFAEVSNDSIIILAE